MLIKYPPRSDPITIYYPDDHKTFEGPLAGTASNCVPLPQSDFLRPRRALTIPSSARLTIPPKQECPCTATGVAPIEIVTHRVFPQLTVGALRHLAQTISHPRNVASLHPSG